MYVIQVWLGKLQEIYDLNFFDWIQYDLSHNELNKLERTSVRAASVSIIMYVWYGKKAFELAEMKRGTKSSCTEKQSIRCNAKYESFCASSDILRGITLIFTLDKFCDGKIECCRQLLYVQLNISF